MLQKPAAACFNYLFVFPSLKLLTCLLLVLQAFRFNADKEQMRQPRIVRVGLVQNSIAVPTTCHFADQKKAIMEKVKLIVDAAGASGVNVLCLQVLLRLAIWFSLETHTIYIFIFKPGVCINILSPVSLRGSILLIHILSPVNTLLAIC
jgi:hypothetical protein